MKKINIKQIGFPLYFNLISLAFLLFYMALHLFLAESGIQYVQSSGGGLLYANFDFFGFHIIDINGNKSGSLISPSIVMVILLFLNVVFLFRSKFSNKIAVNIILLTLMLVSYHMSLSELNSKLEMSVVSDSFWLSELNMYGYQFFDSIERISVSGYNYSVFFILFAIICNASKLITRSFEVQT